MKTLMFAAVAVSTLVVAQADAATYIGTRTVGNGTATLSITTDDTLGVLARANIVDWTIGLTQGADRFTLTTANSQLAISGNALRASATELSFDFSLTGNEFALFQSPDIGSGETFYCVENGGCAGNGRGETVLATTDFNNNTFSARTGVQVLATAGAVPEPATWGLMLMGFGLVGAGLRRRKVAFAAA